MLQILSYNRINKDKSIKKIQTISIKNVVKLHYEFEYIQVWYLNR